MSDDELKAEELAFYEDELLKSEYLKTDMKEDTKEETRKFAEIKISQKILKEIDRENGRD